MTSSCFVNALSIDVCTVVVSCLLVQRCLVPSFAHCTRPYHLQRCTEKFILYLWHSPMILAAWT